MDGTSKKSNSFQNLHIQSITDISELKCKLNEVIEAGKSYEYDISSWLKTLLTGGDRDVELLCVQAIAELAKCQIKRETYARKEFVEPLLNILGQEMSAESAEVTKQCCRALGNLCCDCDATRNLIIDNKGPATLLKLFTTTLADNKLAEIRLLTSKTLLNFAIGGKQFCESIVNEGIIDVLHKVLSRECLKEVMNEEEVTTALLILSVINDNSPELMYEEHVNEIVVEVLRETSSAAVSELCLEHLLVQAEHEEVKSLVARSGGLQLVCARLERLRGAARPPPELRALVRQACDLLVMVLTGDAAMRVLYAEGAGEVYARAVRWLEAEGALLAAALLAIGNFARDDRFCIQMMENGIYDKLLDIFEKYHDASERAVDAGEGADQAADEGADEGDGVDRVAHGALAALRNLAVPAANKRAALARGRAVPLLARALPAVRHHLVAYKLLGALRMLLDATEDAAVAAAARQVCEAPGALRAVARWAGAGHAGAAGEAPRLLAGLARALGAQAAPALLQAEGCVASLAGMVAARHAVMQREALGALAALAEGAEGAAGEALASQLAAGELGQQVCVLVGAQCGRVGAAEAGALARLLGALEALGAAGARALAGAGVAGALRRFLSARRDLPEEVVRSFERVILSISDEGDD